MPAIEGKLDDFEYFADSLLSLFNGIIKYNSVIQNIKNCITSSRPHTFDSDEDTILSVFATNIWISIFNILDHISSNILFDIISNSNNSLLEYLEFNEPVSIPWSLIHWDPNVYIINCHTKINIINNLQGPLKSTIVRMSDTIHLTLESTNMTRLGYNVFKKSNKINTLTLKCESLVLIEKDALADMSGLQTLTIKTNTTIMMYCLGLLDKLGDLEINALSISTIDTIKYASSLKKITLEVNTCNLDQIKDDMTRVDEITIVNSRILENPHLKTKTSLGGGLFSMFSNVSHMYVHGFVIPYFGKLTVLSPRLKSLILIRTNLNKIDPIYNLRHLQDLDISYNNITSIDKLYLLPSLIHLYANNNNIKHVCNLQNLLSIQTIWLNDNLLSNTFVLNNMKSLHQLRLQNNHIEHVEINNLPSLAELDLSNNKLYTIEDLTTIKSLTLLNISNNRIKSIKGHFPNIQIITTHGNPVSMGFNIGMPASLYNIQQ